VLALAPKIKTAQVYPQALFTTTPERCFFG